LYKPIFTLNLARDVGYTIKEALNRFEKSFKQFQKIQVLRFFTCDLILPILIYFYATFLLIYTPVRDKGSVNI
jgi:hypothetical protein